MKCLSLWQPWASLLVHGAKRCETRSWPISHRGPLLIHAAKKWDTEIRAICWQEPFRSALEVLSFGQEVDCGLPLGVIVGRVDVVGCFPTSRVQIDDELVKGVDSTLYVTPTESLFGDFSAGRFAFLCEKPRAFAKPITFRGAQGLFDVPDNLLPKDA